VSSGQARKAIVIAALALAALRAHARAGLYAGLSAAIFFAGGTRLQNATANGDTRTLSLHHTHRGDDVTVTFKRDGRYHAEGLKTLNHFLRDWRTNEQIEMDPQLFDAVWEVAREFGANRTIHVISSYRSPNTNAMLRSRSDGVARDSLHMQGKAMDFFIPGVPLEQIRAAGLRLQRGGVGFYPASGSPFVHIDVGGVRHWPRMTREQLVRVFPDQRTVHIPADGQPLAGYDLARAEIGKRGGTPGAAALAARNAGGGKTVFSRLFGFGAQKDAGEDAAQAAATQAASTQVSAASRATGVKTKSFTVANAQGTGTPVPLPVSAPQRGPQEQFAQEQFAQEQRVQEEQRLQYASLSVAVPLPQGRPALDDAMRVSVARAVAVTPNDVIRMRGFWEGRLPDMPEAKAPAARKGARDTVAATPGRFETPWLRATILTPSVEQVMTATLSGTPDAVSLRGLMAKPQTVVTIHFSDYEPYHGMSHKAFGGNAVHFLRTTVFTQRIAALP